MKRVTKTKPSAGLTKEEKRSVVRRARAGKKIGRKVSFETVANKAARKYGSKESGRRVAAAVMWRSLAKRKRGK